jgi:hypothetical protein
VNPRLLAVPLLSFGLLLGACGADDDGAAGGNGGKGGAGAAGATELEVIFEDLETAEQWTLTCDPPDGSHPDPEGACADLDAALEAGAEPFAEPDPDEICTEQYGGPQTATVSGTFAGSPVDASFARTNGCQISRWDAVGRLLPPGGVDEDAVPE